MDEAGINYRPRNYSKKYRLVKRSARGYGIVILILITTAFIFGSNNYLLYKSNTVIQQKYNAEIQSLIKKSVENQKPVIISEEEYVKENELLKKDNKEILKQNDEIIKKMQDITKQNNELAQKNKVLLEDNIELQNSLKKAASVGVKPQSFQVFEGISLSSELNRGNYIGKFLGTAYTPSKDECGNNGGITNSGKPIIPGISVAIDDKYWPFGTIFYIKGLGYAVAMDTGGAIKGKYRFDFAVLDKKFADTLGLGYWDVYLVKLGDGSVDDIEF
jgi:3D (Asp-Asp-Asp) domain-containing protein